MLYRICSTNSNFMRKKFLLIACLASFHGLVLSQAPSNSSPITPIILKTTVTAPTLAQAKDRLLWYKGKKVNDSILMTPDAKLVLYSKERNKVICQPLPKKDPSIKIITELANTEKRKTQLYNILADRKSGVMQYPSIIGTFSEFDRMNENYHDLLKNTIELPTDLPATAVSQVIRRGGLASSPRQFVFAIIPDHIKKAFGDVMVTMKNYPSIEFPEPPSSVPNSCANNCDTIARKKIKSNEDEWLKSFAAYETGMIQKALTIFKKIYDLGLETDPEAIPIFTGLEKAIEFAFARSTSKVDLLIRKYGKDFTRLSSVIRAALSIERQRQLIGTGDDNRYADLMMRILSLFDGFEKYIVQQMEEHNYDIILNPVFVFSMERQRQLLGGADDNTFFQNYIDNLNAFNRFKIDVQIDYTGIVNECDKATGENFTATNLQEQYVSLYPVNCKYMFFPAEQYVKEGNFHYGRKANFQLEITNGTAYKEEWSEDGENCQLVSHDLRGLVVRPRMPITSINFCDNDGSDSLQFYDLHLPVSRENRIDKRYSYWEFDEFNTMIKNDGFQENYPQELEPLGTELEALETEQRMLETLPVRNPTLPEMEQHYTNAARTHTIRRIFNELEEKQNSSVVLFEAKNRSELIIDEIAEKKYRAHHDEDRFRKADIKIKVKIVHDPLPYKKQAVKTNQ